MIGTIESNDLGDYLHETEELDFGHPVIQRKAAELKAKSLPDIQLIKEAFEYVRDEISHSWDIQSKRITRKASEALIHKEGICYAKSNLLAALLRCLGIPTGFCYQRLTIGDHPDTGYCIHALNAVYVPSLARWIRLDARGNKAGVDAQFSVDEERLAFPVRDYYGEIDYPTVYSSPNPKTMRVLREHTDCLAMYRHGLPTEL
ncbi:transglutaminase-like domain-containing protein [Paenibacillus sp. GYB003]|uniref:transglutaminase-like domain-containing protein n=1 Tax=Paenibacillus sp. GYB003 TaxID=2994392 RepID=UPI002F966CD4